MTVFSGSHIARSLKQKGFREATGDHRFYTLYVSGRKTSVRTKISHSRQDYGGDLFTQVRKQLRLANSRELERLVRCPITGDQYVQLLVQRGHVELEQ